MHTAFMSWRSTPRTRRLIGQAEQETRTRPHPSRPSLAHSLPPTTSQIVDKCEAELSLLACRDDVALLAFFHESYERRHVTQPGAAGPGISLWTTSTPGYTAATGMPSFGLLEATRGRAFSTWMTPWLISDETVGVEFGFSHVAPSILGEALPTSVGALGANFSATSRSAASAPEQKQLLMAEMGLWHLDEAGACPAPEATAAASETAQATRSATSLLGSGLNLSTGIDWLFHGSCPVDADPGVASWFSRSGAGRCEASAVALVSDPARGDACSLRTRLANFAVKLDLPTTSVASELAAAGSDAWDGRAGTMGELTVRWDGTFEQPASVSGYLMHMLVCDHDVESLHAQIDTIHAEGCADGRALTAQGMGGLLLGGLTLAQLMPLTKLEGGGNLSLKVHRARTTWVPPLLQRATRLVLKLTGTDSQRAPETSPKTELLVTLCRDDASLPFELSQ
jgi:hypothetical protein